MISAIGRWAFWLGLVLFWAVVSGLFQAGIRYLVEDGNLLHALFDWSIALALIGVWAALRNHLPRLSEKQRLAAIIVLALWIGIGLLSIVGY
jgi:hypothetical protein